MPLYDKALLKKKNHGLFAGNLEDKLYRFGQYNKKTDHCIVCKKNDNIEYMFTCDRCLINQSHYYCDMMGGILFNCYICPICRKRFYRSIKRI